MKFKYKNQIIETPNIEKKLKRMGLKIEDVEIIKEEEKVTINEELKSDRPLYYFKHPDEDIIHCSIYPDFIERVKKLYNKNPKYYWNEETKTGLGRKWTKEYINELKPYEYTK